MAKKTVINDFSALKGKVNFQEQKPVVPETKPSVRPASASFGGSISVDLHIEAIPGGRSIPKGQQLQFQLETFRKVIRQSLLHKGMTITFIHGIGDGILKAAIRKELDEVLALRCSYSVGDPAVTIVTIR